MALVDFFPFGQGPGEPQYDEAGSLATDGPMQKAVLKLFKSSALALGYTGLSSFGQRASFEVSPYDFERINKAIDTDSYLKQGINKYKELIWKEGWDIVSENDEAASYLRQRIGFMEFAMSRSFQSLLDEVSDQLFRFNNAFIVKARNNLDEFFPTKLNSPTEINPVVGYYVIPAETVEIRRDHRNVVKEYRQRVDSLVMSSSGARNQPRWKASDVIHLSVDKKPGRAFGTPFLISALDDVIALRQLEEDIQNLIHRELFPLYKYKVGTEAAPAEKEEIEQAWLELENLRNDGGLILPERHEVEVIGAQDTALDAAGYLQHFVNRVVVGLGLAPHHLGIMSEGGNRSVTDRLDIALYDKIKTYQRYLSDSIRINIFNELLMEGGFDPFVNPHDDGDSDVCEFKFREIDVDTQVKRENHIMSKWTNNAISLEELRMELGKDIEIDEGRLYQSIISKIQTDAQLEVMNATQQQQQPTTSKKLRPNDTKGTSKDVANRSQPTNQHGTRTSPNIRHSDDWALKVVEALDEFENE